jgi:hypothetical protein
MAYRTNDEGLRRCYICDATHPATDEFFPRDKNRKLGLGYQCRPCARAKLAARDKKKKNRWLNASPEKKVMLKRTQQKHLDGGGWRTHRVVSYRMFDKKKGFTCDLTAGWFREHIQYKSCHYCHRTDVRMGCDRIDNSKGHTKANVVPCCKDCNFARGDRFTHEEAMILGATIRAIIASRDPLPGVAIE